MSDRILGLVAANLLLAVSGAGLLPFMRLARTRRELVTRLPLAYAVGVAAGGILVAHLSLVHVPIGRIGLPLLAAGSLVSAFGGLGGRSLGASAATSRRQFSGSRSWASPQRFVIPAARLYVVKPLFESDGWVMWATRAKALYAYGYPVAPVFTDPSFPALQHPLLLPGLEALDARFMGTFDGTLIHLQLLGFAIAFVGGGWVLLRDQTPPLLLAATLLAVTTAPSFFNQLGTNYADIPLAMFFALGLAALAAWLRSGAEGLLPATVLFLGAAAVTKNEGELFALMAFVARRRRRACAPATAARVGSARNARDRPALAALDRAPPRQDRRVLRLRPRGPGLSVRPS